MPLLWLILVCRQVDSQLASVPTLLWDDEDLLDLILSTEQEVAESQISLLQVTSLHPLLICQSTITNIFKYRRMLWNHSRNSFLALLCFCLCSKLTLSPFLLFHSSISPSHHPEPHPPYRYTPARNAYETIVQVPVSQHKNKSRSSPLIIPDFPPKFHDSPPLSMSVFPDSADLPPPPLQ